MSRFLAGIAAALLFVIAMSPMRTVVRVIMPVVIVAAAVMTTTLLLATHE